MIQTIHAAIAGRARYKVPGLYRSTAVQQWLEAQLTRTDGVHQVTANPVTGNVLVLYDGERSAADIATLIAQLVRAPRRRPPPVMALHLDKNLPQHRFRCTLASPQLDQPRCRRSPARCAG